MFASAFFGVPAEQFDIGAGIRKYIVHAWFRVWRFRHRAEKLDAHRHQPAQRIVRVVDENPAKIGIVPVRILAGEFGHVVEMRIRIVFDTGGKLLRRLRRGERADGPCGRAAGGIVFLDQDDVSALRAGLDRGRKPRTARANDQYVACRLRHSAVSPS